MSDYWTRTTISRRNAIRAAGVTAGGVAALSLIGCGGGSKSDKPATDSAPVTDSTKGKPGGTLKLMLTGPLTALTVVGSNFTGLQRLGGLVHSGLVAFQWGQESVPPTDFSFEPDLAQALPEQPNETTLIYKIRPGAKFQNGRPEPPRTSSTPTTATRTGTGRCIEAHGRSGTTTPKRRTPRPS